MKMLPFIIYKTQNEVMKDQVVSFLEENKFIDKSKLFEYREDQITDEGKIKAGIRQEINKSDISIYLLTQSSKKTDKKQKAKSKKTKWIHYETLVTLEKIKNSNEKHAFLVINSKSVNKLKNKAHILDEINKNIKIIHFVSMQSFKEHPKLHIEEAYRKVGNAKGKTNE